MGHQPLKTENRDGSNLFMADLNQTYGSYYNYVLVTINIEIKQKTCWIDINNQEMDDTPNLPPQKSFWICIPPPTIHKFGRQTVKKLDKTNLIFFTITGTYYCYLHTAPYLK